MRFPDPVSKIKEYINNFDRKGNNTLATFTMTGSQFFPDSDYGGLPVNMYLTRNTYDNLYSSIRQELINMLISID